MSKEMESLVRHISVQVCNEGGFGDDTTRELIKLKTKYGVDTAATKVNTILQALLRMVVSRAIDITPDELGLTPEQCKLPTKRK